MSDSMITLQGWVGSEPVLRQAGPSVVASFRLASTPRRFSRTAADWIDDGVTQWFTVNAWRQLGHNVHGSLRKGDPVVVHGRLVARVWQSQGVETSAFEIEAVVVGHDLTKGCSLLQRNPRAAVAVATGPGEPSEPSESSQPGEQHGSIASTGADPWEQEPSRAVEASAA